MLADERKYALEVNSRIHLEMDEALELLELARKTDPRSWCVLTLAFNHGLRVSECAGGAPAIPGKNRPAVPPLFGRNDVSAEATAQSVISKEIYASAILSAYLATAVVGAEVE